MDGLTIALLIILIVIGIMNLALLYMKKKDNADSIKNVIEDNADGVTEQINRNLGISEKNINTVITLKSDMLSSNISELAKVERDNSHQLREQLFNQLTEVKNTISKSLTEIKDDNNRQLDNMRKIVDKTLVETLEERLTKSYEIISKSLSDVAKGFGELQKLSTGVYDLNKVFSNVKSRGIWGEIMLNSLLEQMLSPEQFKTQVSITGGRDAVDFAIILPGKHNDTVLLPVDSKFPDSSYQRLVDAANTQEYDAAVRALTQDLKKEAKSISEKYIKPPITTDFAIMYLPTEGLFAEAAKREGLIQELQNNFRVMIAGPTTLSSLLSSLQMGFKTLAIEKRSMEIRDLLLNFKAEFIKFTELLEDTQGRLNKVSETIETATKRTKSISRKLSAVESLADIEDEDIEELKEGYAS